MQEKKLWTKDFVLFLCANFFISMIFYLLMTTLAVYAFKQFEASESESGLVASIFVLGALCARLFAGKYVEVFGRKKSIYFSLLLFLLASAAYFAINSLIVMLIVRFIHGLAFGIASTAIAITVMAAMPNNRRGEGTGYFSLSSAAATAIGPFLGLYITQKFDYHVIFTMCTAFALITIAIILFTKVEEANLSIDERKAMKSGKKFGNLIEKAALPICLLMFIFGVGYSSIVSFINTYALEIQLAQAATFFFVIYAAGLFISRPFTGKLLDKKGDNIVIYPAIVFFAVSLILIGISHNSFVLLLSAFFLAFGFGTLMSSIQAIAMKVSPKEHVGLAVATFFICLDAGVGVGPYVIGLIIPFIGFRGMYISTGIIVLCMLVAYYFIHGKKEGKQQHFNSI